MFITSNSSVRLRASCERFCGWLTQLFTENYLLENEEWKSDTIPEIMDGKTIADFIHPDILERLEALEREEEKLESEGFYDMESEMVWSFTFTVIFDIRAHILTMHVSSATRRTSAKPSLPRQRARRSSSARRRR